MKIELIQAWPGRFETRSVELEPGATVADALRAANWAEAAAINGYAVFGVLANLQTPLHEGDRVELLRALQIDPKEARRRRAAKVGP